MGHLNWLPEFQNKKNNRFFNAVMQLKVAERMADSVDPEP